MHWSYFLFALTCCSGYQREKKQQMRVFQVVHAQICRRQGMLAHVYPIYCTFSALEFCDGCKQVCEACCVIFLSASRAPAVLYAAWRPCWMSLSSKIASGNLSKTRKRCPLSHYMPYTQKHRANETLLLAGFFPLKSINGRFSDKSAFSLPKYLFRALTAEPTSWSIALSPQTHKF